MSNSARTALKCSSLDNATRAAAVPFAAFVPAHPFLPGQAASFFRKHRHLSPALLPGDDHLQHELLRARRGRRRRNLRQLRQARERHSRTARPAASSSTAAWTARGPTASSTRRSARGVQQSSRTSSCTVRDTRGRRVTSARSALWPFRQRWVIIHSLWHAV